MNESAWPDRRVVLSAPALSPSRLALFAWLGIGIVLVASMARPAANLPGDRPWLRRFQTPEVARGHTLGQSFVMSRDGLNAIEFYPSSNGRRPSGDITLALFDTSEGADARLARSGTIRAAELAQTPSYRFEFEPIADSRNRSYRFEITGTEATSGVLLRAAKGDGYPSGTLTFNGRSRWADLEFQASAPTPSIGRALWTARGASGFAYGRLILVLLVAAWLAMGALFRALASSMYA